MVKGRPHQIDEGLLPWKGEPVTLEPNQGRQVRQTPDGTVVLALLNQSRQADTGGISLTTGGSNPRVIEVEPLQNAPLLIIRNYGGNNLNVTNVSPSAPIWASLYGPGFGNPQPLADDGRPEPLPIYQSYTFKSKPSFMRLDLNAPGAYSVFVVYVGSKPSTYVLNAPDAGSVPGGCYTKVTPDNGLSLIDNWLGKTLWLVNLSPLAPEDPSVSLTNL